MATKNPYSLFSGIGQALDMLVFLWIMFLLMLIVGVVWGVHKVITWNDPEVIESQHLIQPTIKLTTNGTTVDTVYVYTFE